MCYHFKTTAMTEETEDLHTTFIDKDWIKAGKIYDSTIPSYVVLEKSKRMTTPNTCMATTIFPPPTILPYGSFEKMEEAG
jgi:hypothetical protein